MECSAVSFEALSDETTHEIWSGDLANNVFHVFPERAMNLALFGVTAEDNTETVLLKAKKVGNDLLAVLDYFTDFSDDFLVSSIRRLSMKRSSVEVSEGIDPRKCVPVVIASNDLPEAGSLPPA